MFCFIDNFYLLLKEDSKSGKKKQVVNVEDIYFDLNNNNINVETKPKKNRKKVKVKYSVLVISY